MVEVMGCCYRVRLLICALVRAWFLEDSVGFHCCWVVGAGQFFMAVVLMIVVLGIGGFVVLGF